MTTLSFYWHRLRCRLGHHRWLYTGPALHGHAHYERCLHCSLEARVSTAGSLRETFARVARRRAA